MSTQEAVFNNYATHTIMGQVDITDAGEVDEVRGDHLTCTYDGSGGTAYVLTYKAGGNAKLVSVLYAKASVMDTLDSATTDCSISDVSQDSETGDIEVTFATQNAAGGAATEEATAACTLNVHVVIQTARMSNPLD
jgi:hypothetical protein